VFQTERSDTGSEYSHRAPLDAYPQDMSIAGRQRLAFVMALGIGALWASLHLRGSYMFYDEWSIIELILHHPARSLVFHTHNGHMWVLASLIYRLQLHGWGLRSHWFINAVMVASLVALHAALHRLLRALSVSFLTALLLSGAIAYLGIAAQNIVFAVQFSLVLSIALAATAMGTVLGGPPTPRSLVAVALLAAASVLVENGGSLVLVPALTVLVFGLWGRRATVALLPAWTIAAAWQLLTPAGPSYPASFGDRLRFATRLLLASAGGLFGQAERVGAVVLVVMSAVVGTAWVTGRLSSRDRWVVVGGVVSTVCVIGAIAQSRAGLPGFVDFTDYNRYLQCVALPLTIACTPAFVAYWHDRPAVGPLVAAAMLVLGVAPLQSYAATFHAWNHSTRLGVHDVTVVLRDRCPSGAGPVLESSPLGVLGPQITGTLIADLLRRGMLDTPADGMLDPSVDRAVLKALCPGG